MAVVAARAGANGFKRNHKKFYFDLALTNFFSAHAQHTLTQKLRGNHDKNQKPKS
jgi:hypothetical protein